MPLSCSTITNVSFLFLCWISINMNGAVQHGVAGADGVLLDHPGAWIKRFSKNIGIQLLPLM
jgi:hypothetical protein